MVIWKWLMSNGEKRFPGGSRQRVNRAGDAVRSGSPTEEDINVINTWRAAHSNVINSFQALLRGRTRETKIVVAQRHKRRRTIFDKLQRYPRMQLGRMDDVAGCRLIFPSIEELTSFRDTIHKARFKHTLRNEKDRYDYILKPKISGYRGIHDIYSYNVNSAKNRHLNGLLIELQYRTNCQHAWATACELIGLLTVNEPKFERGSSGYQRIMRLASEIISRSQENKVSSLPTMTNSELLDEFSMLDDDLGMMDMFRALNIPNILMRGPKNAIFIFEGRELKMQEFDSPGAAWKALVNLEEEDHGKDIVFVCGDTPDAIRLSFANYFSDARGFVQMMEDGCKILSP